MTPESMNRPGAHGAAGGAPPDVTVVVPITERYDDLAELYRVYSGALAQCGVSREFLFVLDGSSPRALETLRKLRVDHADVRVFELGGRFGEAMALAVGFRQARGRRLLTLAPYFQVEAAAVAAVLAELDRHDLVITRRHPRRDPWINRLQSRVFHWLTARLTGAVFHDLTCGLRGMTREVAESLTLYGDLHRFIPVLAKRQGFRIAEVAVGQHPLDHGMRLRAPGVYLRRMLDILIVLFLAKFTKKPLRFFGLIGMLLFVGGSAVTLYLGLYRLLGFGGIAERPLLLLGVLLMVLGVQLLSIGLIGEIVIFTHARQLKDYKVQEILD
jgi:glycosyltransferase involved in cell wall biosynthesis